jgi:hypothetical protein
MGTLYALEVRVGIECGRSGVRFADAGTRYADPMRPATTLALGLLLAVILISGIISLVRL